MKRRNHLECEKHDGAKQGCCLSGIGLTGLNDFHAVRFIELYEKKGQTMHGVFKQTLSTYTMCSEKKIISSFLLLFRYGIGIYTYIS